MSLKEQSISGATIDAGGISVKYFAAGIGEPVVLLHCTARLGPPVGRGGGGASLRLSRDRA